MKKAFRSCTLWFVILSSLIIVWNATGNDDYNLFLIGLNPIINFIVYKEPFRSVIWSDEPNFNMYVLHLVTFVFMVE